MLEKRGRELEVNHMHNAIIFRVLRNERIHCLYSSLMQLEVASWYWRLLDKPV